MEGYKLFDNIDGISIEIWNLVKSIKAKYITENFFKQKIFHDYFPKMFKIFFTELCYGKTTPFGKMIFNFFQALLEISSEFCKNFINNDCLSLVIKNLQYSRLFQHNSNFLLKSPSQENLVEFFLLHLRVLEVCSFKIPKSIREMKQSGINIFLGEYFYYFQNEAFYHYTKEIVYSCFYLHSCLNVCNKTVPSLFSSKFLFDMEKRLCDFGLEEIYLKEEKPLYKCLQLLNVLFKNQSYGLYFINYVNPLIRLLKSKLNYVTKYLVVNCLLSLSFYRNPSKLMKKKHNLRTLQLAKKKNKNVREELKKLLLNLKRKDFDCIDNLYDDFLLIFTTNKVANFHDKLCSFLKSSFNVKIISHDFLSKFFFIIFT